MCVYIYVCNCMYANVCLSVCVRAYMHACMCVNACMRIVLYAYVVILMVPCVIN